MIPLNAVLLNCTLKKSPAVSNTEALMGNVIAWFDTMDVTSELIRVVNYYVPFGVSSDEGEDDNLVHLARILKANPIPPEGNTREGDETEHRPHIG